MKEWKWEFFRVNCPQAILQWGRFSEKREPSEGIIGGGGVALYSRWHFHGGVLWEGGVYFRKDETNLLLLFEKRIELIPYVKGCSLLNALLFR